MGSAAGAAAGAAAGSAAGPEGTVGGAVVGAATGAKNAAGTAWKKTGRKVGAPRALLAEFALCVIILALSPLVHPTGQTSPVAWMKRGSALCGVFALLGMISAIGPRSSRAATALGALITLTLLVDAREVFGVIAGRLRADDNGSAGAAIADSGALDIGGAGSDAADLLGGGVGSAVSGLITSPPAGVRARPVAPSGGLATGTNQTIPSRRPGVPRPPWRS